MRTKLNFWQDPVDTTGNGSDKGYQFIEIPLGLLYNLGIRCVWGNIRADAEEERKPEKDNPGNSARLVSSTLNRNPTRNSLSSNKDSAEDTLLWVLSGRLRPAGRPAERGSV